MKPNLLTLIAAAVAISSTCAQTKSSLERSSSASSSTLVLEDCTAHLIEDVNLPALESGQIQEMNVKPGDTVEKGQRIAQLNDQRANRAFEEATLRFKIADERANDVTEVTTAHKRAQLAMVEHSKAEKLRRSGSFSDHEADRAKFSAEVAREEYEGAKKARELAGIEAAAEMVTVKASEDSIGRHRITSPINGQVFELFREAGEWVNAGETVMRVARMDRLRIVGIVEGNAYDPIEIADRPVSVTLELARGRQVEFTGKVVYVSLEKFGNKNSGNYLVWAEVDNRSVSDNSSHWQLQAGSSVDMKIHLDQAPVQSAFAGNDGLPK